MSKTIDFYFDFGCPYSYLAHARLAAIAQAYGWSVRYGAIDAKCVKLAAGNYGPSELDLPAKRRYIERDLARWARRYGVPLHFPAYAAPLANIGTGYARGHDASAAYLQRVFHHLWSGPTHDSAESALNAVAADLGWSGSGLLDYVHSPAARDEFAETCAAAVRDGVFGTPAMIAGDRLFWGNDRLALLDDHLRATAASLDQETST